MVILIISFVSSILGLFPFIRLGDYLGFQDYFLYFALSSIISFIINPILLFIGFYRFGKRFDLKSNLKKVIKRLLIGAYLGHFFSTIILTLVEINIRPEGYNFYWFSYLLIRIFSVSFLRFFFTAFTALAMAYLRHNKSEIQ